MADLSEEDEIRKMITRSVGVSLQELDDMKSICDLRISVHLEEPGQVSGNVMVQLEYKRDVMLMARQDGDSLN